MRIFPRSSFTLVFALCSTGLLLPIFEAAAQSDSPRRIYRFGDPRHAFSSQPATTEEDLKRLVRSYESDLRSQLEASGWGGDPDAFFRAVEAGEAEQTTVNVGERLLWMGFRRDGRPTVRRNLVWAGSAPARAWQVEVTSNGNLTTFKLPVVCLNLALVAEEPAPLEPPVEQTAVPPTCSLEAAVSCDAKTLTLTARTDGELTLTALSLDGRSQPVGSIRASGSDRWQLESITNGTYTFDAVARRDALSTTCSARATVDCPVPVCRISGSYDAASRRLRISTEGSVGGLEVTGLTLPNGRAADVGDLEPEGSGAWSFPVRRTLPRRAGSYTYTITAEAELDGETASCETVVTVPVARRGRRPAPPTEPSAPATEPRQSPSPATGTSTAPADSRWTLRFFGGLIDVDGEHVDSLATGADSAPFAFQSERLDVGDGFGYGLGLEYRASDLIGVELSALFGELDSGFVIDRPNAWGMDDDDVSYLPILLGLNFHVLGRDAPVDLYLGPVVGQVQYGHADFQAFGETFRRELDDELGWGLSLGLDVPFGDSRWLFTARVRYLESDAELEMGEEGDEENEVELAIDPIEVLVGLGVRF